MDLFFILLITALLLFFISTYIQSKAQKQLSDEEKIKLVNEFSGGRISRMLPLLVLLALYFLNFKFQIINFEVMNYIYFGSLVILLFVFSYTNNMKLKKLNFSEKFISVFRLASVLRLIAIALFIFAILNLY